MFTRGEKWDVLFAIKGEINKCNTRIITLDQKDSESLIAYYEEQVENLKRLAQKIEDSPTIWEER